MTPYMSWDGVAQGAVVAAITIASSHSKSEVTAQQSKAININAKSDLYTTIFDQPWSYFRIQTNLMLNHL